MSFIITYWIFLTTERTENLLHCRDFQEHNFQELCHLADSCSFKVKNQDQFWMEKKIEAEVDKVGMLKRGWKLEKIFVDSFVVHFNLKFLVFSVTHLLLLRQKWILYILMKSPAILLYWLREERLWEGKGLSLRESWSFSSVFKLYRSPFEIIIPAVHMRKLFK